MRRWLAAVVDALFPPTCPFCDTTYSPTPLAPVCAACHAATAWLGHPLVTMHVPEPAWKSARALCRFDGPVVGAIHRLKYQQRPDLAPSLGRLFVELAFATNPHDVVLPVPLAPRRLRARGYNQAQLLAQPVARALRAPCERVALRRVRDTVAQVGLDAVARLTNLRGAFTVHPRYRERIDGRRCLLIDDVMTTGATLHAAAMALRRAGATHVHAIVIAAA